MNNERREAIEAFLCGTTIDSEELLSIYEEAKEIVKWAMFEYGCLMLSLKYKIPFCISEMIILQAKNQ